jgi:hypothetical protein
MTRAKSLALTFYFGAALAGAAVGISVDRALFRTPQRLDQRAARERFFDRLHLKGAQRDSATVILDARDTRFKAIMQAHKSVLDPINAETDSVFEEGHRRLSQVLNADQNAIYDQMRRERERAQRPEKK